MYYIGLDDTDTLETKGTGRRAREIAGVLLDEGYPVIGVTRHQLLTDPRVPCTRKNSSAAILIDADALELQPLFDRVYDLMIAEFYEGSDPGLCVIGDVPAEIIAWGWKAKRELVHQREGRDLAAQHGVLLKGLGGTEDGVIGALAAVGLAAEGEDGRYVQIGSLRDLAGLQSLEALTAAGMPFVRDTAGRAITEGLVLADKLRPARRGGEAVVVVERVDDYWSPVKLD